LCAGFSAAGFPAVFPGGSDRKGKCTGRIETEAFLIGGFEPRPALPRGRRLTRFVATALARLRWQVFVRASQRWRELARRPKKTMIFRRISRIVHVGGGADVGVGTDAG
jgi:hypothetical protein